MKISPSAPCFGLLVDSGSLIFPWVQAAHFNVLPKKRFGIDGLKVCIATAILPSWYIRVRKA